MADAQTNIAKCKKSKDFSYEEEKAIANFYVEHRDVFEAELSGASPSDKTVTNKKKKKLYEEMLQRVNSVGANNRQMQSMKNKLRDLKSIGRQKHHDNLKGTGGGLGHKLSVGEQIIVDSDVKVRSHLVHGMRGCEESGLKGQRSNTRSCTISKQPESEEEDEEDEEPIDRDLGILLKDVAVNREEAAKAARGILDLGSDFDVDAVEENRQKSVTDVDMESADVGSSPLFSMTKQGSQLKMPLKRSQQHDTSSSSILIPTIPSKKKRSMPRNIPERHGLEPFNPPGTSEVSAGEKNKLKEGHDEQISKLLKPCTELEKAQLDYFKLAKEKLTNQKAYFTEMQNYYKEKTIACKEEKAMFIEKAKNAEKLSKLHQAQIDNLENKKLKDSKIQDYTIKKLKLEIIKTKVEIRNIGGNESDIRTSESEDDNDTVTFPKRKQPSASRPVHDISQQSSDSDKHVIDSSEEVEDESEVDDDETQYISPARESSDCEDEGNNFQEMCQLVKKTDDQLVDNNKSSFTQYEDEMTPIDFAISMVEKEKWQGNKLIRIALHNYHEIEEFLGTKVKDQLKKFPLLGSYRQSGKGDPKFFEAVKKAIGYSSDEMEDFIEYILRLHRRVFKGKTLQRAGNKVQSCIQYTIALKHMKMNQ